MTGANPMLIQATLGPWLVQSNTTRPNPTWLFQPKIRPIIKPSRPGAFVGPFKSNMTRYTLWLVQTRYRLFIFKMTRFNPMTHSSKPNMTRQTNPIWLVGRVILDLEEWYDSFKSNMTPFNPMTHPNPIWLIHCSNPIWLQPITRLTQYDSFKPHWGPT